MQLDFYAICQMCVIAILRCNYIKLANLCDAKRGLDVRVPADETMVANNNNRSLDQGGVSLQQCGGGCLAVIMTKITPRG